MSSRIRLFGNIGGYWYSGAILRAKMAMYSMTPLRTIQDMMAVARASNLPFWVFREPRRLGYARSRYKKLCGACGIGKPSGKKLRIPPRGALRNVPPAAPPPQAVDYWGGYQAMPQGNNIQFVVGEQQPGGNVGVDDVAYQRMMAVIRADERRAQRDVEELEPPF